MATSVSELLYPCYFTLLYFTLFYALPFVVINDDDDDDDDDDDANCPLQMFKNNAQNSTNTCDFKGKIQRMFLWAGTWPLPRWTTVRSSPHPAMLSDPPLRPHQKSSQIYAYKSQIQLRYLVRSWSTTSFEPDSVMEFGSWWRGSAVEHWSLADVLSLSEDRQTDRQTETSV